MRQFKVFSTYMGELSEQGITVAESQTVLKEEWEGQRASVKKWMETAGAGETFKMKSAVVVCTKGRRFRKAA